MTFVTIFGISTSFLNILENEGSQRTSLITHPSPNHPLTHPPPTNPSANFCISRNRRCKGIIGPQGKTTAPYFDEFAVNVGWVDLVTGAAYNIYYSLFLLQIYLKSCAHIKNFQNHGCTSRTLSVVKNLVPERRFWLATSKSQKCSKI